MTDPGVSQRLDGRVALVTGAASGIGLATADALARAGASVIVSDLDGDAATAAAAEIAGAEATTLDVADEARIVAVFADVAERQGRLDILVNNAGVGARQPAMEMPRETWDRVLDINLTGTFLCSREAAKAMLPAARGAIVNVASIMGLVGGGLYPNAAYHASKAGIVNLTRALALEWARAGIRVNAVAPTFALTPLTEKLLGETGMAARIENVTPMGRLVEPEEVAAAILFLASDAAGMITGHTLPVDGGWLAQ